MRGVYGQRVPRGGSGGAWPENAARNDIPGRADREEGYRYWRLLVVVSVGIALQLTVFSDKSLKIGRYAPKDAAS